MQDRVMIFESAANYLTSAAAEAFSLVENLAIELWKAGDRCCRSDR